MTSVGFESRQRLARAWFQRIPPGYAVLVALLLIMPGFAADFVLYQIFGWTFILGMIALSLMFLAGYGGMVSLVQMTVAGLAGYVVAICGDSAITDISQGWPWWIVIPVALLVAALFATLSGWLAVRTEGIYTIMITLAIAVAFFYFVRQNYVIFNGFTGFAGIEPPTLFGVYWRDPTPFYYLCLAVAAFFYFAVLYGSRSSFGLGLQAVRDNPRRVRALGINVFSHRVVAYFYAGVIAGTAGVLLVWFNGRVSPGLVGIDMVIDILVIAVIGGLGAPIGPFLGAVAFVLLENFAIDLIDRERFNTVIGLAFLLIVLFSPDGMLGLWRRAESRVRLPRANAIWGARANRDDWHSAGSPKRM